MREKSVSWVIAVGEKANPRGCLNPGRLVLPPPLGGSDWALARLGRVRRVSATQCLALLKRMYGPLFVRLQRGYKQKGADDDNDSFVGSTRSAMQTYDHTRPRA